MDERRQVEEKVRIEGQIKGGADWFFWIAGLSVVNSIAVMTGSGFAFVVGLGITHLVDGYALKLHAEGVDGAKTYALLVNLFIAVLFAVLGIFARRRMSWSFLAGMLLYAADGIVFVLTRYWLGVVFHGVVLIFILWGFLAHLQLKRLERAETGGSNETASPGQS